MFRIPQDNSIKINIKDTYHVEITKSTRSSGRVGNQLLRLCGDLEGGWTGQ